MTNPLSLISLKNPWHLLATGFGSGLSPVVPGTMGTLAAVPLFLLLAQLPFPIYVVVVLIFCLSVDLALKDRYYIQPAYFATKNNAMPAIMPATISSIMIPKPP